MTKTGVERWPLPSSAFVGREEELRALGPLVERHRLLTVLGAPGIGKTRLTLEWFRAGAAERWPGGVRFCDLSDASSADEVVRFVAKALRVSLVADGEQSVAHFGAALAALDENLLVLDNFERVLELAHPLVTAWLLAAPRAHFLLTSRERLKLDGEVVFELGPLLSSEEREDGVTLFVERARAVRSTFELGGDDVATVRELVRELDGNPLAIELAAARSRVLSPKEILARMPKRFELLVAERRGQPRRSALLEAIEMSWNALPEWGKAALSDCAVFRGGFDLAGAESVVGLEAFPGAPPVVDVIESLCDKSLIAVRRNPGGAPFRFVLHASIHAFATLRLGESGGRTSALARHAAHFARACEAWSAALRGPEAPRALDELRIESENLTAALRFLLSETPRPEGANRALVIAVTLAGILGADGPFALRAWALEEAIAFADRTTPDPALLVEALDTSVLALVAIGRPEQSRTNARRSCTMSEPLGAALHGRVLSTLGLSFAMAGDVAEARKHLERAMVLLRGGGDRLHEGRVLGRFAWLDWMTGDLESASARFLQALAIHRATGDRTFEAMNSGYLAVVAHELGDLESPLTLLEHAIAEQQRLGHRRIEADVTSALGSLFHERGALDEARAMHHRALEIYRQVGHTRDEASLLADIAKVALDVGLLDEARASLVEALPLAKATGNALTIGEAEAGLGVISAHEGRLDVSRAHFERARSGASPGPRGIELVELLRGHLDVAEARAAFSGGDVPAMNEHLAAARARLAAVTALTQDGMLRFRERRLAVASLTRVIEEASTWGLPPRRSDEPPEAFFEGDAILGVFTGRRAVLTPEGIPMELERHPALWRLVECFATAHTEAPGRPIAIELLVKAGWPDERVRTEAGARRVYTALSTLRRRGLRAWILKSEEGYALAPHLRVIIHP